MRRREQVKNLFHFLVSNSRRWHGRPLRPPFEAGNQPRKAPNLRWRCDEPCFSHEHRLKLFYRLRREWFRVVFFLLLTFFDGETQRAGMLAIEGFLHRLRHRALVQVREEHARPRHALQHRPVHAQREARQQHHRALSKAAGCCGRDGRAAGQDALFWRVRGRLSKSSSS